MRIRYVLTAAVFCSLPAAAAEAPKPLASGLKNPESVLIGFDGRIFVSLAGEVGTSGAGAIAVVAAGKATPFAAGLDHPRGMAFSRRGVLVADDDKIRLIDFAGKSSVYAEPSAFPVQPTRLSDLATDNRGTVFAADAGDGRGKGGAVYRIARGKVDQFLDASKLPGLISPSCLLMDGEYFLLVGDAGTGLLHRVNLATSQVEKVAEGLGEIGGLVWDAFGRLVVSDRKGGRILVIPHLGDKPAVMADGLSSPRHPGYDFAGMQVVLPDAKAGTLSALRVTTPGTEVDETPLNIRTEVEFPKIKWAGWNSDPDNGVVVPFRPVVMAHAGDGSNRLFVGTEQGVVHMFRNDPEVRESAVFLDLQDRVKYNDRTNEEGFLGLAFHPKFKENGEVFVYYTTKQKKLTNHLSRFRLSKSDPNRLDPNSEEVLIAFEKPYWNHDGGTIVFGPDGCLYTTHGDGGFGNDPHENGQNLGTLLGKVHRIDVDHKENGKNYAIPKDNPFVGRDGARPEIWAYGLRNIWRMSFDRKTGALWAADVGQNLFEEIDVIVRGGNYGWNRREGFHPFSRKGVGPRPEFIEPVWEYNHGVGQSITGGGVYRGAAVPELDGWYIYGDYVTSRMWALKYDEKSKRVVANRPLKNHSTLIFSFGEDEKGEMYVLSASQNGRGIFTLRRQ